VDALAIERNDYARTAWFASVVPMMEITMSSEVVLLSNSLMMSPDGNHAALLRPTAEDTDALIRRVIKFYQERGVPPCVAVSPNCTPPNLARRLLAQGFKQHGDPEYWLALVDPQPFEHIHGAPNIQVDAIGQAGLTDFCEVMACAYGMPAGAGFILEHFFGHINTLPGIHNYLARQDGQPAGCLSLFQYKGICALGSGSTLPNLRSLDLGWALLEKAIQGWNAAGRPPLVTQTVLPRLERIFTRLGFRRIFSRTYYILE
jgi:hypothetical protein